MKHMYKMTISDSQMWQDTRCICVLTLKGCVYY